ncbi:hypothetical protein DMA11_09705 [Marinilabiliaceae bacterium JC017]|nr:hypothetical protein DMA11_09705 [Marinilabiliaceae bacterium JC017]
MFWGILVRHLKRLFDQNALKLPAGFEGFESLKQKFYNKKWYVFSDKAFGGLSKVLELHGALYPPGGHQQQSFDPDGKGPVDLLL